MQIEAGTRNDLVQKIGTLMVANAELGSVNNMLLAQLQAAETEIKRLNAVIEAKTEPELPLNGANGRAVSTNTNGATGTGGGGMGTDKFIEVNSAGDGIAH